LTECLEVSFGKSSLSKSANTVKLNPKLVVAAVVEKHIHYSHSTSIGWYVKVSKQVASM